MKKRIGIVTHNVSGTDGVSLEILKWYKVLERIGYECYFFGAEFYDFLPKDRTFQCSEASWHTDKHKKIIEKSFGANHKNHSDILFSVIESSKESLKLKIFEFINKFSIDTLLVENAMAIPVNVPLGLAIEEILKETNMPAVAHNHDFYWERDRYMQGNRIQEYLDRAFPVIGLENLKHVVINSKAQRHLKERLNTDSTVVYNVCDFLKPIKETSSEVIENIREDAGLYDGEIFFLQPVRVVPRKKIEYSIDFLEMWNKTHTPTRLVIPHAEKDTFYIEHLKCYAKERNVELAFLGEYLQSGKYELDDVYNASDFIFFTSDYEGFGNALLETIYFKKPMLVNRYEIFIDDIEPTGLDVIKIDNKMTEETVDEVEKLLANPSKIEQMVETNFYIANKEFSFEYLEEKLRKIFS